MTNQVDFKEFNFEKMNGIEDIQTPFGTYLSGKYKKSLAYIVIKNKLPLLLDQIIDLLNKNQSKIFHTYTTLSINDINQVVEGIKKLKNELITNKPLIPLLSVPIDEQHEKSIIKESDLEPNYIPRLKRKFDDVTLWNTKLEKLSKDQGEALTWFNTVFFISESYFYRRIAQEFFLTKKLQKFDPFNFQKHEIYYEMLGNISLLSEYIIKLFHTEYQDFIKDKESFINLFRIDLWGNKSDLYLSSKNKNSYNRMQDLLMSLDTDILVDDSEKVWELFYKNFQSRNENTIIDFILDNAGYELFTDLCLAAFLTNKKLATKIRLHVKCYPWFISDTTTDDINWLITTLLKSEDTNIQKFGSFCYKCLTEELWTIEEEPYWTQPFDYSEMKNENPLLYNKLLESTLVIIKGDLNYSKLLRDLNWKHETSFSQAHQGFEPTNLVCLRTIKSDIIAGLPDGTAEKLSEENPEWMYKGKFGLIQASLT